MKKTLIALAVAASAAVSGSAMAWTASGIGGTVDLGGTLTPDTSANPWEVFVGSAVNGLDATIPAGSTSVNITLTNAIPLLGVRTVKAQEFSGATGIAPQISFGQNSIDATKFVDSVTPFTADVMDANNGTKVGVLTGNLLAGAMLQTNYWNNIAAMYASSAGNGFYGGIPTEAAKVLPAKTLAPRLNALNAEFSANFVSNSKTPRDDAGSTRFSDVSSQYSAYYGAGFEQGSSLNIKLTQSTNQAVVWKASLPVTVSYQ
ncbi:hypothetical protein [Escherichia coli]|uniref:F4 family fimbrial subunit n=1 Tax=Escherichia coli TaxID=562 RepID=UPI0007A5E118|nr:hypothetical protein [Escherichia coli]